ncbi:MAG TPA: hypothetical protein VK837_13205 [Longimicrobiales bacterium]|nr:hypothetical protein [Longimicrobiales bacterium]
MTGTPRHTTGRGAPRQATVGGGLAAALTLTLGALALTATLTRPAGGQRIVAASPPEPGGLAVHVAFQLDDCPSTLAFLEILQHPSLADRVAVSTLLFLGEASQVATAARALGPVGKRRRVRTVSAAARRSLRNLGLARTPFFFVEDSEGALRFAAPVPTDPRQLRALHASLHALADLEARRAGRGT